MRILLTGASGYVGSFLLDRLVKDGNHKILSWGRSDPVSCVQSPLVSRLKLDLNSPEEALSKIDEFSPEVICHLAAMSLPSDCERKPEEARRINVEFTRLLCVVAKKTSAFVCFVSTEWVFDGRVSPKGGFLEQDDPQPVSVYGQTKYEAERLVQGLGKHFSIVRPSLIYGPSTERKVTVLGWIDNCLKKGEPLRLFEDEWRTPVFIEDVVGGLLRVLLSKEEGIFHFAGPEKVNRVEFGKRYLESLNSSEASLQSVKRSDVEGMAFRAEDIALNSAQTENILGLQFRSLTGGFKAVSKTELSCSSTEER